MCVCTQVCVPVCLQKLEGDVRCFPARQVFFLNPGGALTLAGVTIIESFVPATL